MPSNHLILYCPLFLCSSVFPSIRVFSNESLLCIRWPKYWNFSFSISPSNEYSGLISFRIDWFDLLAVKGTLKSSLKHYSPKASILWCSAFFMVQISHPYITTGKTIALTRWTFVSKVISLFFNKTWYIYINPNLSVPPSPLYPHSKSIHLFSVCVSISALQIGSSVPFFWIPHICVVIRYLFF